MQAWKARIGHVDYRDRNNDESSLDRRLMEAKEAAVKLEKMFAENKRNDSKKRSHFVEEYYHNTSQE